MRPVNKQGWMVFKGRGEIADLHATRGEDGALYSLWRPSIFERVCLIFGAPVAVGVLSERQPPIAVKVGEGNIPLRAGALLLLALGASGCAALRDYAAECRTEFVTPTAMVCQPPETR